VRRFIAVIGVLTLAGCSTTPAPEPTASSVVSDFRGWAGWEPTEHGDLVLASTDFDDGGDLPSTMKLDRFGCTGENIRPELHWSGLPEGTKSVVITLTMADGGGPANRWIAFDIPPETTSLPASKDGELSGGGKLANADKGIPMLGPCIVHEGDTWEMWFTIYALDMQLGYNNGVDILSIVNGGQGHVLETAELSGTFR
jgi:phosphatidylethanolamine-binding protein (PEBP) family uncharacterized protein